MRWLIFELITSYYLSIEVKLREDCIFVSQESYARGAFKNFKIDDCKPIKTPIKYEIKLFKNNKAEKGGSDALQESYWSLLYLTYTRHYILYETIHVSRYNETLMTTQLIPPRKFFDIPKVQLTLAHSIQLLLFTSLLVTVTAIGVVTWL